MRPMVEVSTAVLSILSLAAFDEDGLRIADERWNVTDIACRIFPKIGLLGENRDGVRRWGPHKRMKPAMAVGDNRRTLVDGIVTRHFLQSAGKAGLGRMRALAEATDRDAELASLVGKVVPNARAGEDDDADLHDREHLVGALERCGFASTDFTSVLSCSFSSLKTERVRRKAYRTRDQARADVFDYIERFHNPKRRHSTIGYRQPGRVRTDGRISSSWCPRNRPKVRLNCGNERQDLPRRLAGASLRHAVLRPDPGVSFDDADPSGAVGPDTRHEPGICEVGRESIVDVLLGASSLERTRLDGVELQLFDAAIIGLNRSDDDDKGLLKSKNSSRPICVARC